jgi:hypothetical protein
MRDLLYRPNEFDDWGMIRNADGSMYASVRRPEAFEGEFDQCRSEKTDPFADLASMIVSHGHLIEERDRLREENERLRAALKPFAAVAKHDIGSDTR